MNSAHSTLAPEIVIEPGRTEQNYWRDLWLHRELFHVLAWRDLTVRYKQTVVGVAWAVIRPLLTMVIFTVVFNRLANLPSDGSSPYAVMVFAGMLPWIFVSAALSDASNSIIGNAGLIGKVYFPRIVIPVATIVVAFVDFLINFALLVLLMSWYQFWPGLRIVWLPLFILLAFVTALGPSLWITSLIVRYRDFRHVVPFIAQFGLYVSPVGFSSSLVPDKWRLLYSLNPVVGIIDGFRWCILGRSADLYVPSVLISSGVALLLLWRGIHVFRRTETVFADVI